MCLTTVSKVLKNIKDVDCVREIGIYFLFLERRVDGALLVPPAAWPLAGLGGVLWAGGPPLWGTPVSPG